MNSDTHIINQYRVVVDIDVYTVPSSACITEGLEVGTTNIGASGPRGPGAHIHWNVQSVLTPDRSNKANLFHLKYPII